jgi:hypothetical protein
MAGGLLFSLAMTLFTTPVVYLYLDRLSGTHRARKRAAKAAKAAGAVHGHGEPAVVGAVRQDAA